LLCAGIIIEDVEGVASRPFLGRAIHSVRMRTKLILGFFRLFLCSSDGRQKRTEGRGVASPVLQFGIHHGAVVLEVLAASAKQVGEEQKERRS
jgi:hypothetical protein